MVLSFLAMGLLRQRTAPSQAEFSPKVLQRLGLRRQRVVAPPINRSWVKTAPKTPSLGSLKNLPKFFLMNSELVSNIDKAGLTLESQGDRGTCTIFATKFLVEYELARQSNFTKAYRLNPEYLNWAANAATKTSDDGSSFPAVVDGLDQYGCSNWSDPKVYGGLIPDFDAAYKPSNAIIEKAKLIRKDVGLFQIFTHQTPVLSNDELDMITGLLDAKIPVAVGQQWPSSGAWKTTEVDGYKLSDGTGPVQGAHTMAIVGYRKTPKAPGGGYFLFHNSWGTGGDYDGYLFMSFDWVRNHTYDGCIALPTDWKF